MNKEQLIQIAKVGFPEMVQQFMDFDNMEMHVMGDVYRLYRIGTPFMYLLPREVDLIVMMGADDFVQITTGYKAFDHYAAIKEMQRLGLIGSPETDKHATAFEYLKNLHEQVMEHGEIKLGKDHFYYPMIKELYK